MKTSGARYTRSAGSVIRIGIFIILAALITVPLYTASSASLSRNGTANTERAGIKTSDSGTQAGARLPFASFLSPLPSVAGIVTFNNGCVSAQSNFVLGEV